MRKWVKKVRDPGPESFAQIKDRFKRTGPVGRVLAKLLL